MSSGLARYSPALKRWLYILGGILLYSLSLDLFLVGNNIAAGGISGLAVVLNQFVSVNVATLIYLMNIPILLAALLTNLNENDILFVDEIHRLNRSVEEVLYPAMEDYAIDIIIGKGPSANSIRLDLPKFTLIGATTRAGQLSAPLRDRFGVTLRLELYTPEELALIVTRSAGILEVPIEPDGAMEIARRSRGTPRIANRMLRRVRDFAQVTAGGVITRSVADRALKALEIDGLGLDNVDRRMMEGFSPAEREGLERYHQRMLQNLMGAEGSVPENPFERMECQCSKP